MCFPFRPVEPRKFLKNTNFSAVEQEMLLTTAGVPQKVFNNMIKIMQLAELQFLALPY